MHMYEFRTAFLVAFDLRHASVDHLLLKHRDQKIQRQLYVCNYLRQSGIKPSANSLNSLKRLYFFR